MFYIHIHKCVLLCLISRYMCAISILEVCYKCFISVFVAIFGINLIFGLTGPRTDGPSD